jgi:hypothetical protein
MKIICDAIVALSNGNYTDDDQDNEQSALSVTSQLFFVPPFVVWDMELG